MAGLIGTGLQVKEQAMYGLDASSKLAQNREDENQMIEAAHKQQMGSMAGTGAVIGFQAGGPVGALIGAGVGAIAGAFL
jgi:hypothetical protein